MAKKPSRMSDIHPLEKAMVEYTPFKDVIDREGIIHGFNPKTGNKGPYIIMKVTMNDTGEELNVSTGASAVLEQMAECTRTNAFPVMGTFRKIGDAYVIE